MTRADLIEVMTGIRPTDFESISLNADPFERAEDARMEALEVPRACVGDHCHGCAECEADDYAPPAYDDATKLLLMQTWAAGFCHKEEDRTEAREGYDFATHNLCCWKKVADALAQVKA